ncbi:MAG TPA: trypsin-like serine protease, partial [Psychromonas hadalis]|nr:trypsin-like serine protease [Psychromonas hadalis]
MTLKKRVAYLSKPILAGLVIAFLMINAQKFYDEISTSITHYKITSYSDAVLLASPSVVNIYSQQYVESNLNADSQQLKPTQLGSGVIMNHQGYIVTNYHVIKQADQIVIALQDGRLFTGQVIGSDKLTDLAVLHIKGEGLPVIPQNKDYSPNIGDVVLAIGNPYNLGQTITQGIISAMGRSAMSATGRQNFLQTDAAINAGNSGGPLINTRGELVAITTSEFYSNQQQQLTPTGISFAVPYKLATNIIQRIIKDGRVIRSSIGVVGKKIDPLVARLWGIKTQNSIVLGKIMMDSPAEKAGLLVNDILLEVDELPVTNLIKTMDYISKLRPHTKIKIKVKRAGEILVYDVV